MNTEKNKAAQELGRLGGKQTAKRGKQYYRELVAKRKDRQPRCKCNPGGSWMQCTACEGRIHLPECTSRRNSDIDCCKARHKMLHAFGFTHGLQDASVLMLPKPAPTKA